MCEFARHNNIEDRSRIKEYNCCIIEYLDISDSIYNLEFEINIILCTREDVRQKT